VKRQTLLLVVIGVVLFVAGGAIAFTSVLSSNKQQGATTAASSASVAVVTSAVPAGTTGEALIAQDLVTIENVPAKTYQDTDLTSVAGLSDEVLTTSLAKGAVLQSTELSPSTSAISLPKGMDGVTITVAGVAGLAGYLQSGTAVDVYANITKLSTGSGSIPVSGNVTTPCTELLMTGVEVLNVSNVTPALSASASSASRVIPSSITILLAVNPSQSRVLTFMSENETLSVVQTQKGTHPVAIGACVGTGQTTSAG
jgi:Flp pilus assembly protein CpaB